MKKRIFITSTGTGIGKTYITSQRIRQAKAEGQWVEAYKPVISGFSAEADSDTRVLLQALGRPLTDSAIDHISPWRYVAPLAPSIAARIEGRPLNFDLLVRHSREILAGDADVIMIEGVGGIMAPLTDHHTVLDWAENLACEVWLIVGTYLGSISHTLTALEVMKHRGLHVTTIVVNETELSSVSLDQTYEEIERWAPGYLLCKCLRGSC